MPPAVALFTRRHPEVELTFMEKEPEEAVAMLRGAELELALVFEYRDLSQPEFDRLYEGIERRHLIDDPMYVAMPADHPAARKQRVRLGDFADDVWIQNDTRGPCGRLHLAACVGAGFECQHRLRVRRLQRRAGPDCCRSGSVAPTRAVAHERP